MKSAMLWVDDGLAGILVMATGVKVTATNISCEHGFVMLQANHYEVRNISYAKEDVRVFWLMDAGVWPTGSEESV